MIVLDPLTESPLKKLSGFDSAFSRGGHDPIAVFDFDGVLCAPTEDLVYKLGESSGERAHLCELAEEYQLDADIYDTPYLRHLLLQAIMKNRQILPDPGPMLALASELSRKKRPFFILTARSGHAAVSRVLEFLDYYSLAPQEVFFVGRVAKGQQLSFIGRMPKRKGALVYLDDSMRHSYNSRRQLIEKFEVIRINWGNPDWDSAKKLLNETLYLDGLINRSRFAA